MEDNFVYPGRELEAMSFAVNYHRWILDVFDPYLGSRLVEVGAGAGSFSELLLERLPVSLALVEPSADLYRRLGERIGPLRGATRISLHHSDFRSAAGRIRDDERPDSVIYVNVLEHVDDDVGELETVRHTLKPGGRIFIFVPALRWLKGRFDERVGHVRRYVKGELEQKCRWAGFRVIESRYFDFAGVVPWWLKYRLFKSDALEPRAVELYDRFVVRFTRALEKRIRPPLGKNIILIAEKL